MNEPCAHRRLLPDQEKPNRKRLIICCDGTWNNTNDKGDPESNASRLSSAFARSCCSGMPQVVFYHPGAGTEQSSWFARVRGGAFGHGVPQDIAECYRFICDNYRTQDELIFLGFSRGAFTVRSVAGLVCSLGFLNRAGLDQLPHIFRDYCSWSSWTDKSKFDTRVHLVGFTLENMEKNEKLDAARWQDKQRLPWRGDKKKMQANLDSEKRELFEKIVMINRDPSLDGKVEVPKAYQQKLAKHELVKMLKERKKPPGPRPSAKDNLDPAPAHDTIAEDEGDGKAASVDNTNPENKAGSSSRDPMITSEGLFTTLDGTGGASSKGGIPKKDPPEGKKSWGPRKDTDPVVGKVRAIGVWDTVGSLGVPKTPITRNTSRHAREIQLESLEVHPNVEYAFHAIALDEWRTAFRPTMWGKASNNTTTQLRQVWFPGSHGNVGGGWKDQQIATIALAWMADQLTPLGVEFSRPEMERIFYAVNPGVMVREWGMGEICNPSGATTWVDKGHNLVTTPFHKIKGSKGHFTRTPGMHRAEGRVSTTTTHPPPPPPPPPTSATVATAATSPKPTTTRGNPPLLQDTNELVHPCVRLRLLYGGFDLDDKGKDKNPWNCCSLLENGWNLKHMPKDGIQPRLGGRRSNVGEYLTVAGPVHPYYGNKTAAVKRALEELEARMPIKVEPWILPTQKLDTKVPEPNYKWYWSRSTVSNTDHETETETILEEEQIGVWEQRFIDVNERVRKWQQEEHVPTKRDWLSFFSSSFPWAQRGSHGSAPPAITATDTAVAPATVAMDTPAGTLAAAPATDSDVHSGTVGTARVTTSPAAGASGHQYKLRRDLGEQVDLPDSYLKDHENYGLHDIVVWENWIATSAATAPDAAALSSGFRLG